jgi:predicted dehydrogenase
MRALVVGLGSIGRRHTEVLKKLNLEVATYSQFHEPGITNFESIEEAVTNWLPEYIVISNPTYLHERTVDLLGQLNFTSRLLIEKPLAVSLQSLREARTRFSRIGVGFNLRFSETIQHLKQMLKSRNVLAVEFYYGNHLTNWRNSNYLSYSLEKDKGGGVLRDFSHELDLSFFLFGESRVEFVTGGKIGNVTKDSDDFWRIHLKSKIGFDISIGVNCLDSQPKREIRVLTTTGTILADLLNSVIASEGNIMHFSENANSSYLSMHSNMIGDIPGDMATLDSSIKTDELIQDIENWRVRNGL